LSTRCGVIDVQQACVGMSLLMIHGSGGGGHDQWYCLGVAVGGE
jgi:hypothetical protein